jgi:hypothetical protein
LVAPRATPRGVGCEAGGWQRRRRLPPLLRRPASATSPQALDSANFQTQLARSLVNGGPSRPATTRRSRSRSSTRRGPDGPSKVAVIAVKVMVRALPGQSPLTDVGCLCSPGSTRPCRDERPSSRNGAFAIHGGHHLNSVHGMACGEIAALFRRQMTLDGPRNIVPRVFCWAEASQHESLGAWRFGRSAVLFFS